MLKIPIWLAPIENRLKTDFEYWRTPPDLMVGPKGKYWHKNTKFRFVQITATWQQASQTIRENIGWTNIFEYVIKKVRLVTNQCHRRKTILAQLQSQYDLRFGDKRRWGHQIVVVSSLLSPHNTSWCKFCLHTKQ